MSYESARFAIERYFKQQWDAYQSAHPDDWFPVEYPNVRLKETEKTGAWGRLSIVNGVAYPREVGTASTRVTGIVYLQIFVPEDSGVVKARKATDYLVGKFIYRIFQIDDGILRVRGVSGRELSAEGGWDRTNVEVEFTRDAFDPISYSAAYVPLPP
jgi:Bacteriophage related domain of unknown function